MTTNQHGSLAAVLILALAMIIVTTVSAQLAGSGPEVNWYTVDGGGGTSAGGTFKLSGTAGQPDASNEMTGGGPGGFSVTGGFWPGAPVDDCPADINNDGNVNVADLLGVIAAWGTCPDPLICPPDVNGDGFINVADLLAVIAAWGPCPA